MKSGFTLAAMLATAFALVAPIESGLADDRVVTILVTGDVGLNRNQQTVAADHVQSRNGPLAWSETTTGIAHLIDGDLNFLNLETVVTDRNDLTPDMKGQENPYLFRSHPEGVRHLVRTGFNLFSLANNHSMDYGVEGLLETLDHVSAMTSDGLRAYAGIGHNREEAGRPALLQANGVDVAFSAIGIVTNNLAHHRAGANRAGQIAYRFDEDFVDVTDRLAATDADYRILSIHYGREYRISVDEMQRRDWRRRAAQQSGIDLIIGHHAHVVRPVEINGDSIIFYGLGNLLHHGTRDIASKGRCMDYGLMARVHLLRGDDGTLSPRAIEAVPITDTHHIPSNITDVEESHAKIAVLNYLASDVDAQDEGAWGVRFSPQPNGSGLFCWPGAGTDPGRIGTLCQGWAPAAALRESVRVELEAACAPGR